jgi:hypothetical protein
MGPEGQSQEHTEMPGWGGQGPDEGKTKSKRVVLPYRLFVVAN